MFFLPIRVSPIFKQNERPHPDSSQVNRVELGPPMPRNVYSSMTSTSGASHVEAEGSELLHVARRFALLNSS